MSISKQLYIMIFVAVLGMGGVSFIGFTKINAVFEKTNYANVNSVPSILLLNDTMQNGYRLRLNLWEHISTEDSASMEKSEQAIKKVKESIDASLKKYEGMLSDDADKASLEKDKAALLKALEVIESVTKLSRENKNVEAAALLNKSRPILLAFTQALDAHIKQNGEIAKNEAEKALEHKGNAEKLMLILSLIVIATCSLFGYAIRKSIIESVHLIRDSIQHFVQHKKLTFRINYDKNNEIKEIVDSFNALIVTLEHTISDAKNSSNENASVSSELSATSMQIGRNAEQSSSIVDNTIEEINSMSHLQI